MATVLFGIILGSSKIGLTLTAQPRTISTTYGDPITTGFVEVGDGHYMWEWTAMPVDFRGAVYFYDSTDPTTILAMAPINPEELQNTTQLEVNVDVGHSTDTSIGVNTVGQTSDPKISVTTGVIQTP